MAGEQAENLVAATTGETTVTGSCFWEVSPIPRTTAWLEVEAMSLEEFEAHRPTRGKAASSPPQMKAIQKMTPGTAIILDHGEFRCQVSNGGTACNLLGRISRFRLTSPYTFQCYHLPDGRLAVACVAKDPVEGA